MAAPGSAQADVTVEFELFEKAGRAPQADAQSTKLELFRFVVTRFEISNFTAVDAAPREAS
jgi:hypothetical protein